MMGMGPAIIPLSMGFGWSPGTGLAGSGVPAWVPPDALFSLQLDTARDRYWVANTAYSGFTNFTAGTGSTFGRASAGYYTPTSGLMASFASGAARLGDRGLLYEPAATNLWARSNEFGDAAWTKANLAVTSNAATAPNGAAEADKITETAVTAQHFMHQSFTATAVEHSLSLYLHAVERNWVFPFFTVGVDQGSFFDLSNGALGTVAPPIATRSIEAVGSYYRVAISKVLTVATWFPCLSLGLSDGLGRPSYLGVAGSGVNAWGAQLEVGSKPTSPIVTAGSSASRAADALTIAIPDGTYDITFTFADDTTQTVFGAVVSGGYAVPITLDQFYIKSIDGYAALEEGESLVVHDGDTVMSGGHRLIYTES